MATLNEKEIAAFVERHTDWKAEEWSLVAEFAHDDFAEAMEFVNKVAAEAEKADHHPDIDIRWNKVRLAVSTHSEGGITQKDLDLARSISLLA